MATIDTAQGTVYVFNCPSCGLAMGIADDYIEARRKDGRDFYCPNGHVMSYHDSDAKKLKRERERSARLAAQLDQERAEREHAERRVAATRGVVTKQRKKLARVANGVCPCCNRSFVNLARHMETKHPRFDHSEPHLS